MTIETAYLVGLGSATVIAILLSFHTLEYWSRSEARLFTGVLAAIALWAGAQFFQTLLSGFAVSVFWSKMVYVGVVSLVFFYLLYVFEYTDHEHLVTARTKALLAVEPVAVVLLVFTNEVHHLFWRSVARPEAAAASVSGVAFTRGPLLWVHFVYSYVLLLVATALLIRMFLRSRDTYRHQVVAMIVATVIPWAANGLFFAGVLPFDMTAIGFLVTGVALWVSMYQFDFVDLSPVARDTVLDNVGEGMLVLDQDDRLIDVNEAGRRLLGLGDRRVIGRDVEDVLSHLPGAYERYADVMQGTDEVSFTVGDEVRHYRVEVSPLSNKREETVGRLFMVRDVTDRRQRQRELERQNEQLDQFASLVSHDLRNPLNVAEGYVGMIEERGDGEVTEYAREVDRSHRRMRAIIDDVLTMARQGQTIAETEPVDLETVAAEAWGNVDTGAATLQNDPGIVVQGDRDRLLQVFENLFRNAVDHGPDDVTVTVGDLGGTETGVVDPEGRGFFVADDGPGIPEDRRDEVFEAGHTTAEDGTGLGLSIVDQFVEAHGWEVGVSTADSGGARFEVTGATPVEDDRVRVVSED